MSVSYFHCPITSYQVSKKSKIGKYHNFFLLLSLLSRIGFIAPLKWRTAASLKAQVSTLVPYMPSWLQPTSLHTFSTSFWLQNQKQHTFIWQIQQLDFIKTARSLPFQPLQPSAFEENGKKASPFSLLAMHKPL